MREEPPNGVGLRIEEREAAEFVAEDLERVLGEAVGEAEEGFVDGGFEGGVVVVVGGGGFAGGGGEVVVDVDVVCVRSGDGRGGGFADGFVVGVEVVGWVGGWEGRLGGPGFGGCGGGCGVRYRGGDASFFGEGGREVG